MIKRDDYKPRIYGLSAHDEPGTDCILTANVREYPDMYYAYKRFGQLFDLENNTFMLANGCENAIKNVLLALNPSNVLWNTPTWRMWEVYSEALNFKLINNPFIYTGSHFEERLYKDKVDIYYCNAGITPSFKYNFDYEYLRQIKSRYNIVDLTYKTAKEMYIKIKELKTNNKNIIVGSFDKIFGGGLRLGYAIYPKELHQVMSIQRENFINATAVNLLTSITDFSQLKNESKYKEELQTLITPRDFLTDNYLTICGDVESTLNCVKFSVDNYKFTRFGIPNNDEEMNALKIVLNDYRFGLVH